MAMHEERDQSNPELLAPIDLEPIEQATQQWATRKAYKSALIAGAVTTSLSATYFYFNPDLQTFKHASIASTGTLITAGIAHWVRKNLLLINHESWDAGATAFVHNRILREYNQSLPNHRPLHTLPFEDYNNTQSRLAIYRCMVKPNKDTSIDRIIFKYQNLANTRLRALQISNQTYSSPEILNRLRAKFDFFAPTALKIQQDNSFINTLQKKIIDWCDHVKQSSEYKAEYYRPKLIDERITLHTMLHEITNLHQTDVSLSDQTISELHHKTIKVLSGQYAQMLDANIEKTKEYNQNLDSLDDDMKKFIEQHIPDIAPITLPSRLELPKSIGKEEE